MWKELSLSSPPLSYSILSAAFQTKAYTEAGALVFPGMCRGRLMEVMSTLAGSQNDKLQPQHGESSARQPQRQMQSPDSNFCQTEIAMPLLLVSLLFPLWGGYFLGNSLSGGIETLSILEWKSRIKGFKCLGVKLKRECRRFMFSNKQDADFLTILCWDWKDSKESKTFLACQMYLQISPQH